MEGSKIENKSEISFEEIENSKENKFDYNELSEKNLAEKNTNKENYGKHKLRSKFSYRDNGTKKEDFIAVKNADQTRQNYYSFNPKTENIYELNGLEKSSEKTFKDENIDLIFFKDKSSKKMENDEILSIAESFNEKIKKNFGISEFDKEKFHSEKFINRSKFIEKF
jgi:hypothetical protein